MFFPILIKWSKDKRVCPLSKDHWNMYFNIHVFSFIAIKSFPNFLEREGLNDKINWLKLFDQDYSYVNLCDKLKLKDFVMSKLGRGFCPETLKVIGVDSDLDKTHLPDRFVLKTNHDSGGVIVFDGVNRKIDSFDVCLQELKCRLKKKYGYLKGEWPYLFVNPQIYIEEYICAEPGKTPPDYKFHCSNGKVLWLQYIFDRNSSEPKEILVDADGIEMEVSLSHNLTPAKGFKIPDNWDQLIEVASKLSLGFKYVRIDLYCSNASILVGEMTFYPLAGCYKGQGQKMLGNRLIFDYKNTKPPVFCEMLKGRKFLSFF